MQLLLSHELKLVLIRARLPGAMEIMASCIDERVYISGNDNDKISPNILPVCLSTSMPQGPRSAGE